MRKYETTTNGGRAQGEEGAYHLDPGFERAERGGIGSVVHVEKGAEGVERVVRFRTERERARGRDGCG